MFELKKSFTSKLQACVILYAVLNLVLSIPYILYLIYKLIALFIKAEENEPLDDAVATVFCGPNLLERYFDTKTAYLQVKYCIWISVGCIHTGFCCLSIIAEVKKTPRMFIPWIFYNVIVLVINYFGGIPWATSACNSNTVPFFVLSLIMTHLAIYVSYRRMQEMEEELMKEDDLGKKASS